MIAEKADRPFPKPAKIGTFVLAAALMIFGLGNAANEAEAKAKANDVEATKLELEARRLLVQLEVPKAEAKFKEAKALATPDHAARIDTFLDDVHGYMDPTLVKNNLADLSEEDYLKLKAGKLIWLASKDSTANHFHVAQMMAIADERPGLMAGRAVEKKAAAELSARTEKEAKLAEAKAAKMEAENNRTLRRTYGKVLRNKFLDDGFDIEVSVSGRNYDRITLQYALMNAVWTRKLQTSGGLQGLFDLGFVRVDMTDGYDYHEYYTKR